MHYSPHQGRRAPAHMTSLGKEELKLLERVQRSARGKRRRRTEREVVHLEYPPSAALPPPYSPKAEAQGRGQTKTS